MVLAIVGASLAAVVATSRTNVTTAADETVARIVTTLRDNKQALVDSFSAFRSMDPKAMHVDIGVPYHPGALSVLNDND